ncbi:MAG: 2-isopropylmalate synthase [bacterium]|nr:2-isopropylmalate synthase [bacterium]
MNHDNSTRIIIFDTTLRDGEQSPGASLNTKEKLQIARQLAKLGVDVIEAGFPISSPGDFEAVHLIAKSVQGPTIAGLARAHPADIDRCWEAVKPAKKPRIHTFIATSDIHIEKKLRKSKEEVIDIAVKAVKRAKGYTEDVEFSCEDAARTDKDYMCDVVEAVIDAGATTVNIPDTVGYSNPFEFGQLIKYIMENVPNIKNAILSVHCHNDLGLAVANSLAAILNGARQVECTINGIGERAGNASLEEIVMNLKTRQDFFKVTTGIKTEEIYRTSRLVSTLTGIPVQPNKAIVGSNAFAHEAGIHQDGVLKERLTYEIMTPESVGWKGTSMVMGKHSGRHAFKARLAELGYADLSEEQIQKAFERFKVLADKKKTIFDEDLIAIVEDEMAVFPETYVFDYLHVTSGTEITPTAKVRLLKSGKPITVEAKGDGPVDAAYIAIDKITKLKPELLKYGIKSITGGTDALGEVSVTLRAKGMTISGRGSSEDIIIASAKAYLNAINKVLYLTKKQGKKKKIQREL